jgi:hypothetical protein
VQVDVPLVVPVLPPVSNSFSWTFFAHAPHKRPLVVPDHLVPRDRARRGDANAIEEREADARAMRGTCAA